MRIYTTPRTTAQYYDRAPLTISKSGSSNGAAPHAATQRWTYTVPSARKLLIELLSLTQIRLTVAAPVGLWQNGIQYTPNLQGIATIWVHISLGNNIGDKDHLATGLGMTLLPGDVINQVDTDTSTGGTTTQQSGMKGTEFDA